MLSTELVMFLKLQNTGILHNYATSRWLETSLFPNGISWRIPIVTDTFSIGEAVNILGNIELSIKSN